MRYTIRSGPIYLAGPMTGLPDFNYRTFNAAASILRRESIEVHNPAEEFDGDTTLDREVYMRHALASVLRCVAVVVLPGWETSPGVKLELVTATAAGIPVYGYGPFVRYWRNGGDEPKEINILADFLREQDEDEEDEVDFPPRVSILREASDLITGDRNNTYGPPSQDFARTAGILTALGFSGPDGVAIVPHHVAMIIAAVKLSRLTWSPGKRDNWTDLAGYAGCGWECVVEELKDGSRSPERGEEGGTREGNTSEESNTDGA